MPGPVVFALALPLGVPAAGAAGSVYVASITGVGPFPSPGTISQFAIGTRGLLAPLAPATVPTGLEPSRIVVTPDGKGVYVTNPDCSRAGCLPGTVSQYTIDPLSGALTPKTPPTVATGTGSGGLVVTPDGRHAYVANSADNVSNSLDNTISQYVIDPISGALTPTASETTASPSPEDLAVTPDGRSLYATSAGGTVSQYSIDPASGALSPKTPTAVAAGATPFAIAVTPNGRSAYVTSSNCSRAGCTPGTVSQYTIDAATGALSPKAPATVAAGALSDAIAVTPDDKSVYVTNATDSTVSQYTIDPTSGALSPKSPATVATGQSPGGLAVAPDGGSLYVINAGGISQYSIDPAGGELSPKFPASVPVAGPSAIAVGLLPAPAKHATVTSVSCSPSVFASGDATVCEATVTDTASAGQTTPRGAVRFISHGHRRTGGCVLSGSGASASCTALLRLPAGRAIMARYRGDATHIASSASTGLPPAIYRVSFRGGTRAPELVVHGRGFGRRPRPDPRGGTSNLGQCGPIKGRTGDDYGSKLWISDHTQLWSAGNSPLVDCMGLIVTSYNGSEIACRLGSFYALNYKQRNGFDHGIYELARGDLVRVAVNGTVWTGRVQYGGRH